MTSKTLTGRITKYDISNIFINGDLYFLPQEIRQSTQDKYPVGTIITATIEKGSVKTIEATIGDARDKFLKEEEAKRNAQSGGSLPPTLLEKKLEKAGFKPPTKEEAEKNIAAAKAEADQRQKEHQDYIKEITAKESKPEDPELTIRRAIRDLMQSEKVGYRISLAGMVNSVIEMKKISTDAPKTYAELEAEVKRDAIRLFIWCDSLTMNNIHVKKEGD